jgi:hypothetical protein
MQTAVAKIVIEAKQVEARGKVMAARTVAKAVIDGEITLMDVVAYEEKNPRWCHGLSECVAYVLME